MAIEGMGLGMGLVMGTGTAKEAAAIFRNEGTAFLREGGLPGRPGCSVVSSEPPMTLEAA